MENAINKSELLEALVTKEKTVEALKLDLMLLELEEKQGLMDGIKLEDWAL